MTPVPHFALDLTAEPEGYIEFDTPEEAEALMTFLALPVEGGMQ